MEQVKRGLESGALRPGDPLPGVRRLAEALVVNPRTVHRAYRELASEGVLDESQAASPRLAVPRRFPQGPRGELNARRSAPLDAAVTTADWVRENDHLVSMIAAEATDRARRDWELERAREVQQRLLPQEYPPIAGLDYAGMCRPALAVGGDYYDFIRLSETGLAIAIGDVSGKGIAAALLMTTLRAYLHGQTMNGATDPEQIVASLNRLVCESFSPNRYATFFYAHYDSSARALLYVNAGHNPPFVFRTGTRPEILRLHPGGPVVGFTPDCAYSADRVALERGDLIVAFTDGISEAMDADGDQWGEERLAQAIAGSRGLSARELVDRIVGEADQFAGGTAQHDDMTLVALRVA
jgi:sigma-B regulation protein RsbU (phosphoserine phosphatase)